MLQVRADLVRERLPAIGSEGGERTTRPMVTVVNDACRSGSRPRRARLSSCPRSAKRLAALRRGCLS
jgi:hypothetical protein